MAYQSTDGKRSVMNSETAQRRMDFTDELNQAYDRFSGEQLETALSCIYMGALERAHRETSAPQELDQRVEEYVGVASRTAYAQAQTRGQLILKLNRKAMDASFAEEAPRAYDLALTNLLRPSRSTA